MATVEEQLKEVEDLVRDKHQQGRHSQSSHTPKAYGKGGAGGGFESQVANHPDVKKYFEKGPDMGENNWSKNVTYESDRGRREIQKLTVYEGKDAEAGKYMARVSGGARGSLSTRGDSKGWFDTPDAAIDKAMSGTNTRQFLKTTAELFEYRKREPSGLWHGYD